MISESSESFADACAKFLSITGKSGLSIDDKREISRFVCKSRLPATETVSSSSSSQLQIKKMTVISAYSDNYTIGKLCAHINRLYCGTHGYEFLCHVLPQVDMEAVIAPRTHCTWYKVKLIIDILTAKLSDTSLSNTGTDATSGDDCVEKGCEYLFWIDSDAIFVDHSKSAESFVERGRGKDLIMAEDMSPCCLLNAGVMLIKVSTWSLNLWTDVWTCSQYFDRPFYEQAALLKCLKLRKEGLYLFEPFHTYLPGATPGDKFFPHVAVFPHIDFNTNRGFEGASSQRKIQRKFNRSKEKLKRREKEYLAKNQRPIDNYDVCSDGSKVAREDTDTASVVCTDDTVHGPTITLKSDRPGFIYHAAGRCDKLVSLVAAARAYGFTVVVDEYTTS